MLYTTYLLPSPTSHDLSVGKPEQVCGGALANVFHYMYNYVSSSKVCFQGVFAFWGLHSWDPLEFYLFTSFKAGHMEATKATVTSDTSMEIFTFPAQKIQCGGRNHSFHTMLWKL